MIEPYIEHLQVLPEPYRSKAIASLDPAWVMEHWNHHQINSAASAIQRGFKWVDSEEGWNFWSNVIQFLLGNIGNLPEEPDSWKPKQINGIDL